LMAALTVIATSAVANKTQAQESPLPECAKDPACKRLLADTYSTAVVIPEKEQDLMQKAQGSLARFFKNFSIKEYLSAIGEWESVESMIRLAILHPYELSYRPMPGERIVIERRPSAITELNLSDSFVLKTENGKLKEIGPFVQDPSNTKEWAEIEKALGLIATTRQVFVPPRPLKLEIKKGIVVMINDQPPTPAQVSSYSGKAKTLSDLFISIAKKDLIPSGFRVVIEHGRVIQVGSLRIEDDGYDDENQAEKRLSELTKKIKQKIASDSEKEEFKNLYLGIAERQNELRTLRNNRITTDCAATIPEIGTGTLRIPSEGGMIRFTTRAGQVVIDLSREGFPMKWNDVDNRFEVKKACVDTVRRRYQEWLKMSPANRGR